MTKNSTHRVLFQWPFKHLAFAMVLGIMQLPQILTAAPTTVVNTPFLQETVTIKGTVKDAGDGQPLPGVTISNDQKKVLGTTDGNGSFTVKVIKGTQISFNMIGYTVARRMITTATNTLMVNMTSSSSDLDEVVVTALGIRRQEK
jgi:hypothetical protein